MTREGGKWVHAPWHHVFGDEYVDVWSGRSGYARLCLVLRVIVCMSWSMTFH